MKVKVEVEVQIPANTIVFDIGVDELRCTSCRKHEKCDLYPGPQGTPGPLERIQNFVENHKKCIRLDI